MTNPSTKKTDFAILGGGAAGLSMFCHLHKSGLLENKQCLIIEPLKKTDHDRTWSFWERTPGPFEHIVHHRWSSIGIHNHQHSATYSLAPLEYKVIFSSDFYRYCNQLIDSLPNVQRIQQSATTLYTNKGAPHFTVGNQPYIADYAFSSLPKPLDYRKVTQPYLDQHFRGWFIRTQKDCFDPNHATIMDFRTKQNEETRFFYVLPTTKREALVEIAIFSNQHLTSAHYDQLITDYLSTHWALTDNYEIYHTEQGVIPMTTYPYPYIDGHLFNIGLGGGFARPSTGYTFYNLQRCCAEIVKAIKHNQKPSAKPWPKRHLLYDATLLNILQKNTIPGEYLFPDLFAKNPTSRVLDFLNAETTLIHELQLMSTTQIGVFGKSFIQQFFQK